ncbi:MULTISPECIES: coenzyme F420-0:L-glutamate ligase [unclassified Croceicoccus]|uniref:coenzyme F420-0:L-glutamate ligase n=1 Tax=unclassified Croceicoccus TaxID=2629967 RepID=UPI001E3328CB|nr:MULTISPECIES: coenzyme F420-0:L-glutamate ligase [unclassified Croceicoccus]
MFSVHPVGDLPEFLGGDDLPSILADRLAQGDPGLAPGDILVVTQKIVSKSEGRMVALSSVEFSDSARDLARQTCKDPALVELVLRESSDLVRAVPNVLITRHRLGHVMANAGIDASNLGTSGEEKVLLLPEDPDASAARIAHACHARTGIRPGVIISDSFGRPWRIGTTNVAIGVAGPPAVIDERGKPDRDGRIMQVTQIAFADAAAGAAGLVMGEGPEGLPACVLRGLPWQHGDQTSRNLLRPAGEDLFR